MLKYAVVPDSIVLHPPTSSGELIVFELEVAFGLVALVYEQRAEEGKRNANRRVERARQLAIKRNIAGRQRKEITKRVRALADTWKAKWPRSIEVDIGVNEFMRELGRATNTDKTRLYKALRRLRKPVQLPNRGPKLPPLIDHVEKRKNGLTLTINISKRWFPTDPDKRRKIPMPLPIMGRGEAANALALYLLSYTWVSNGSTDGVEKAALMRRLNASRWRAITRAMESVNKYLVEKGRMAWQLHEADGRVIFAQTMPAKKPAVCKKQATTHTEPITMLAKTMKRPKKLTEQQLARIDASVNKRYGLRMAEIEQKKRTSPVYARTLYAVEAKDLLDDARKYRNSLIQEVMT